MDKTKIIHSLFGDPLIEFTLYPWCEYLYNGDHCLYLEPVKDTLTDTDKVLIEQKDNNNRNLVDRISLSPIELTVEFLDRDHNDSSVILSKGIKVWDYQDTMPPYKILYNGRYFVYTDSTFKKKGIEGMPVAYISDIQAIRSSYNS